MEAREQSRKFWGAPLSLWVSFFTGLWTLMRAVFTQLRIIHMRPLPVDLPFYHSGSPLLAVSNITLTLFLLTLLGIVAAAALFAHGGKWRYRAAGMFLFNLSAYGYWFLLVEDAFYTPPGVEY